MKRLNKDEFRKLPAGRKLLYVVRRYTCDIFLGGILLLLLGTLIWEDYIKKQPVMSVEMINSSTQVQNDDAFDVFLTENGYCCQKDNVAVGKHFQFGDDEGDLRLDPGRLLMCKVLEGKTDLYFWDTPEVEEELMSYALVDLRTVLPVETLEKYEDQLVYSGSLLHGGYPCAIYLEDNSWVQEHEYYDSCMVGVARNTKDLDVVSAFLAYIL